MKRTYSETEKYELVKRYHDGEHATDICLQAGIPRSTFYTWLKPYETSCTKAGHDVSAVELDKMKKRVQKLEQTVEILKKANCTVSSPLKEKLDELESLHGQYSVHVMCEALEVPRGTFYNHMLRNERENSSYQAGIR